MIYRVINKQTGLFIRDDFTFDELTEIGLQVNASQGFVLPKWNFDKEIWEEGGVMPEPTIPEPTLEDRVSIVEISQDEIINVLAEIVGVNV